ncbi:MAG: hypothetical protein WBF77_04935 [Sulfurimonadaceae bacterium]
MFAFYESDWFTIVLEILFLLFIAYDTKRYFQTGKREYLINIVLAIVFFFWALVPFYNKYYSWQDVDKESVLAACVKEHNQSYCSCLDDKIFKEYDFESFKELEKRKDKDYLEFVDEVDKECRGEGSWF